MDDYYPARRYPYPNSNGTGQVQLAMGRSPVPVKRSRLVGDDGNQSRSAKAQRRHRENRKAEQRLVRPLTNFVMKN